MQPHIKFSPDGNWLAYVMDGLLHIVDVSGVQVPEGMFDLIKTLPDEHGVLP